MTVTENRPATDVEPDTEPAIDLFDSTGFAGALATGDHKAIGRMYILLGLFGGLLATVLGALVAFERTDTSGIDLFTWGNDPQTYFQAWSLGRTSLLFFCVIPLLIGLATYIVPLQVGAPSIAFPRAAAAAMWTWLVGMGVHVATVFVDGGLGVPERTVQAVQGTNVEATELSLLSIGICALAIMLAMVCIMTTVIAQRPVGMTLFEVPLFAWSMLVAGGIWLLAFPVWIANLAIVWVDFRGADAVRYGNVDFIWDELGWIFSQPMVFAFAIPVLGIIGDIIPVAAGRRQRAYGVQQAAIGAMGVLTFGAFAQPFFNVNVQQQPLFVLMSLALIVPILAFAGGLADTLMKGRPKVSAHFMVAFLALDVLLAAAAVAAIAVAGPAIGVVREFDKGWLKDVIEPFDDLKGTVIATGVMQLALIAAAVGAIAGLYYWAPKIFGRRLNAGAGGLAGLALFGGALLVGVANVVNGFLDEGDQVFRTRGEGAPYLGATDIDAIEVFNIIGFVGAVLLVAGFGLVLADITVSALLGKGSDEDADDPWNGHTLEWAGASPPPVGNFDSAPPAVVSERPLLDIKEDEA